MKQVYQTIAALTLFVALASPTWAQSTSIESKADRERVCHTMGNLDRLIHAHPKMEQRMASIEKQTNAFVKRMKNNPQERSQMVVTIPVVFHVLYNTAAENISEAQVLSQLQIMNDDFRRLNADQDNVWSQAADTQIEFCLATQDPQGNPSDGILRVPTSVTQFGTNDNMKFSSQGGSDAWPASEYLNFWVCDLGASLLGYAQFPGGPANTDGVVCTYTATGDVGTAQAPFDLGRTGTHEIGHWLNLRHIWGDGGCGADDFVADTPEDDGANYGCSLGSSSCEAGVSAMVQNYMDYSDDACMNLFTQGQGDRMNALFQAGGARASLLNSPGCTPAVPDFDLDAQAQSVLSPSAGICAASVTPVVRIRNNGAINLTSLDIAYSVDGIEEGSFTWTGSLAYAESEELTLAVIAPADGDHTFTFNVSNPNGQLDEDAGNNEASSSFFINSSGSGVTISVGGGSWDGEIGWSLDLNGQNYASGGAGSVTECIPNGCYTFSMTDTYGDGWNGATYTLTDGDGVILASGDLDTAQAGDGASQGSDIVQIGVDDCGLGCTDATACNYDPEANLDDGSCDFDCTGCTDPSACNYDEAATQDDGSCAVNDDCGVCGGDNSTCTGCTDPAACNYDASALFDDGSCAVNDDCGVCGGDNSTCGGCTDPEACNYDVDAVIDDGSCILEGIGFTLTLLTDNYPGETTWTVSDSNGNEVAQGGPYGVAATEYVEQVCLGAGCYTFSLFDSFGDGICCAYGDGAYTISSNGLELGSGGEFAGQEDVAFCLGEGFGCTDESACNFDPEAVLDDGSCDFGTCQGCTDPSACNYDANATVDDGSCLQLDECGLCGGDNSTCGGCTDPSACNYDAEALIDDGSCVLPDPEEGCPTCDYDLNIVEGGLAGNEPGTSVETAATGTLGLVDVVLNWTNLTGDVSWAADLLIEIGLPDGSCVAIGGYDLVTGCPSLGDYLTFWPAEWQATASGTYATTLDLSGANLSGTGLWTFTLVNGYGTSAGAGYDLTLTLNGLCTSDSVEVSGCTDETACNYNSLANLDDGSCEFESCQGCTDASACNYDASATVDDGTCLQLDACGVCGGDDSSCSGCTNPEAENFDPAAIVDDGSCEFAPNCPEDLNNDGQITVADILELLADFGCTSECGADLNGDGATNVNDILQILAAFGTDC